MTTKADGTKSDSSIRRKRPISTRLGRLKLTVSVFAALVCFPLAAISSANYWTMWQTSLLKKELNEVKAEFVEKTNRSGRDASWVPGQLQKIAAKSSGSNISSVRILDGDASDEQLGFLGQLSALETLELSSNLATDKTLQMISELPNIRYLTLIGNKFSVVGLLRLRALEHLEQIRINIQQYSPIELAVLKAELPGVRLSDYSGTFGRAYRDIETVEATAA